MTARRTWWQLAAIVGIPLLTLSMLSPALGQDEFETWAPFGDDLLFSNDDNWVDADGAISGAPSISLEIGARMNGGTMIIDDDVDTAGIIQNGGSIEILSGASLTSESSDFQSGVTTFNGSVSIAGGGKLTGPDISLGSKSSLHLPAADSALEATGDLSIGGDLNIAISSGGVPTIEVGGAATIKGRVLPSFEGITPEFGNSWQIVSGASSVNASKASVVLPESVSLGRGLNARVEADGALVIGNLPILQVERITGASTITNVVGGDIEMTGYNIRSASGLLNDSGFTGTGAAGFDTPNPVASALSEISLQGMQTIGVGNSVSIGNAYNGGATHPNDEDVVFEFSTPSGEVVEGLVEYLGPANDIVANANPETGEVTIYHLSPFIDAVDITGYLLTSPSGSLVSENWSSFASSGTAGDGWTEANPSAEHISELNLSSATTFSNGTAISIGNVFAGTRDLQLQYATGDDLFLATVTYGGIPDGSGPVGCTPTNALAGDLDGDGTVGFPDFLALSANFGANVSTYAEGDVDCNGSVGFPDFLALSANFGTSLGATAGAAVPEPNGLGLMGLGGAFLLAFRRRRNVGASGSGDTSTTTQTQCESELSMKGIQCVVCALVTCVALFVGSDANAELVAYFPFEDGDGTTVEDFSGNDFHAEASDTFAFSDAGFQGAAGNFGEFNNGAFILLPEEFATGGNGLTRLSIPRNSQYRCGSIDRVTIPRVPGLFSSAGVARLAATLLGVMGMSTLTLLVAATRVSESPPL